MNLYAHDLSNIDFSHSFSNLYDNPFSRLRDSSAISTATFYNEDDDVYRANWGGRNNRVIPKSSSPPKLRHDGSSPLPLGMDWSPPPKNWDGRDSLWPHDPPTGWSYCVTIPSWSSHPKSSGSGPMVLYQVQVGLQSPEGITSTRAISRRFNEFLDLFSELKRVLPKKHLPPAPPKKVMSMKNESFNERRRSSLEEWMEKLLSDIDVSRSVPVASFLELEAAVRSFFSDVNHQALNEVSSNNIMVPPLPYPSSTASIAATSSIASTPRDDTCHEVSEFGAPRYGDEDEKLEMDKPAIENAGTEMEDLVARLNQEVAARQFLMTKVKDLELELEITKRCSEENMGQSILNEKEKFTQMQSDMEELERKCPEVDVKIESEWGNKVHTESTKMSILEENEILLQRLDASRQQLEELRKQHEEFVTETKEDVKLLVEEVKSLRDTQLDLKQECNQLMKEKSELERELQSERQKMEQATIGNQKLLHNCEILHDRLEDCSVDFLIEEEDNLIVENSSASDAIDLLATSDNRFSILLAEAKLLAQDADNADGTAGSANQSANDPAASNNALKKTLVSFLVENARLRKQMNSIARCALHANENTEKDEDDKYF